MLLYHFMLTAPHKSVTKRKFFGTGDATWSVKVTTHPDGQLRAPNAGSGALEQRPSAALSLAACQQKKKASVLVLRPLHLRDHVLAGSKAA